MIFQKKKNLDEAKNVLELIEYVKKLEQKIVLLENRIKEGETKALQNFSKFSISRFNSFSDMGGDQSFTLTLLNEKNNGFILTSLFRNDTSRVFTKPIINGISEYQLLEEEEKILKEATNDQKTKGK
ncbi:MAG: DUF4446 family protein [Candidatus Pacebacteria bacterium]|nr:DUF4446 family protein [Candidatus Paceibacterota bacterium]MDD4333949.1 DUF4446 family protein [Candidatus Paceibacterota bacterium]